METRKRRELEGDEKAGGMLSRKHMLLLFLVICVSCIALIIHAHWSHYCSTVIVKLLTLLTGSLLL